MRRLAFALLSLGFAPAPLPKRDRETPKQNWGRELAALTRRLDELGVKWEVVEGRGGRSVRVYVRAPDGDMSGYWPVAGGDLPGALRQVVSDAEDFFRRRGRR